MKKILYVDMNKEFVQDLEMAFLLEIHADYDLRCIDSIVDISQNVNVYKPDLIILAFNILAKQDSWNINGIPIAFCARNKAELEKGAEHGHKTIGIIEDIPMLLKKIEQEPYEVGVRQKDTITKKLSEKKTENPLDEMQKATDTGIEDRREASSEKNEQNKETDSMDFLYRNKMETLEENDDFELPIFQNKKEQETKIDTELSDKDYIEKEFEKDLYGQKRKTKVVSVYSAKGGVGKTTIATELATYLSLVNLGRRKLRVCIIDYNIDFGDVRATLSIEADSRNLTYWSAEIREFKEKRMDPIVYSKEEMEKWLCRDEKSGLYVLPAPLTNEESMMVETEDLKIILENLIQNGEFDFIICDTGNNTRDSTMIALEQADIILLIMTQNVNTANCDRAFLETMKTIDFDMSRIRLVINSIMPAKATSISTQEIIDFFPYECIGKIRFHTDVIKAANLGEPLAYQPDHEITKQMRSLVQYLLNDKEFEMKKKKRSIWDILFRRR